MVEVEQDFKVHLSLYAAEHLYVYPPATQKASSLIFCSFSNRLLTYVFCGSSVDRTALGGSPDD